jgi:hypothetical protein
MPTCEMMIENSKNKHQNVYQVVFLAAFKIRNDLLLFNLFRKIMKRKKKKLETKSFYNRQKSITGFEEEEEKNT